MDQCGIGYEIWPQLDVCASLKMSVVVSQSMSQSSNFEESCGLPLSVGMQGVYVCLHSCVHRFNFLLGGWIWFRCHSEVL